MPTRCWSRLRCARTGFRAAHPPSGRCSMFHVERGVLDRSTNAHKDGGVFGRDRPLSDAPDELDEAPEPTLNPVSKEGGPPTEPAPAPPPPSWPDSTHVGSVPVSPLADPFPADVSPLVPAAESPS